MKSVDLAYCLDCSHGGRLKDGKKLEIIINKLITWGCKSKDSEDGGKDC